jgi:hypothetical protein
MLYENYLMLLDLAYPAAPVDPVASDDGDAGGGR